MQDTRQRDHAPEDMQHQHMQDPEKSMLFSQSTETDQHESVMQNEHEWPVACLNFVQEGPLPDSTMAPQSPNRSRSDTASTNPLRRPGNPHASELEGFSRINIGQDVQLSKTQKGNKRDRESTLEQQTSPVKERRANKLSRDGIPHSYPINSSAQEGPLSPGRASSLRFRTNSTQSPPLLFFHKNGRIPPELKLNEAVKPSVSRPMHLRGNSLMFPESQSQNEQTMSSSIVYSIRHCSDEYENEEPVNDEANVQSPAGNSSDVNSPVSQPGSDRKAVKRQRDPRCSLRQQFSKVRVSESPSYSFSNVSVEQTSTNFTSKEWSHNA